MEKIEKVSTKRDKSGLMSPMAIVSILSFMAVFGRSDLYYCISQQFDKVAEGLNSVYGQGFLSTYTCFNTALP